MATKEIYEKAKYGDCTPDELALFKEDEAKIKRVRSIIQNFDSFLPKDNKIKVPGNAIACLLIWAKPSEDIAFHKYFKDTYEKANGKREVPTNSAVNIAKGKIDTKLSPDFQGFVALWENYTI